MEQFKITEYGAVPNTSTVSTKSIQKAIDSCFKKNGGRVICDSGVFITGTLILKSNVELFLEAGSVLKGSENLSDYQNLEEPFIGKNPPEKSNNALICASYAENISIRGAGTINGAGPAFYDHKKVDANGKFEKPETQRPRIIMFYRCKNVLIEDIGFVDSACWTIWLMQCENVCIHRIKVSGDRRLRNIDGIDIDACKNVTVSDCIFDTEDDCIVVRNMKHFYKEYCPCENITVTNCVLKTSCNGIRIGCPSDGEIRNCLFSNIVIEDSGNSILFEYPSRYKIPEITDGANVHDIGFNNVIIHSSKRSPVAITVDEGIELERISDIYFSNIRVLNGTMPVMVCGNQHVIIKNIVFNQFHLNTAAQPPIMFKYCQNIQLNQVEVSHLPNENQKDK
ncbi:MAG TPA: glycosyl hydrolase family 28 protein [bacterium]|nr:glycosyl hydrolase family 28 protein [bacterium]HOL49231.1 glycosyl hydrolase family 28 protein [bacterium]HPO52327.1 glycosyl hydrolase family 28 protein [bacterium]